VNRLAAYLYDSVTAGVEAAGLSAWRAELLAGLEGRVLEVGAGTGHNLAAYPPAVSALVLAEPDAGMRARLRSRAARAGRPTSVVAAAAEALPFPAGSFDAAVSTLVLCSVRDPAASVGELRRVLRPGGQLVVVEHVAGPAGSRQAGWQRRVEPLWRHLAGNCRLTRDTAATLAAGFDTSTLRREDMARAPFLVRPTVRGVLDRRGDDQPVGAEG